MSFLSNLTAKNKGYHLPAKYIAEKDKVKTFLSPHEGLLTLLEGVRETYFKGKITLSQQERKEFINIAHTVITADVMKTLKISAANITCKDGVDRAAGSTVNLIVHSDVETYNGNIKGPKISFLKRILCLPSLWNHGRAPKKSRHQRAIPALQRMLRYLFPSSKSHSSASGDA